MPTVPTVPKKILMMRSVPRQQFRAFLHNPGSYFHKLSYMFILLQSFAKVGVLRKEFQKKLYASFYIKNFHVCIMKKCKWNRRRDVARGRVTRKEVLL